MYLAGEPVQDQVMVPVLVLAVGVTVMVTAWPVEVLAVLPHGTGTVTVVEGGLEIPNDAGTGHTVIANCCAIVRLDV